jgi:4,5-DOPA dioxygenase extradiol
MTERLPAIFLSHGSPTLALDAGVTGQFWQQLAAALPRPKAVLCASAHWMTTVPAVSHAMHPETIHDFYGFPEPMYAIHYAAQGAPALADRAAELIQQAGMPVVIDPERGLDHGAWVPLRLMYPEGDVPVTQLAVQPRQDARWHVALGEALQPLRDEGVLVLATGGATHNLRELNRSGGPVPDWARAFDDWLVAAVENSDRDALVDWERQAPNARRAHPSEEHFLPLFVALGAGGRAGRGRRIHEGWSLGGLSMAAFEFTD